MVATAIRPEQPRASLLAPAAGVRAIAFYLPQFHPIRENNQWWGTGFTEWTNVVQGRPQFPGHYQPHLPADLGLYDLRVPEVRAAQAELAQAYGLHAFCYYHYWFQGQRLLEQPFEAVLASGTPTMPFCLCWANERWTRTWDGRSREVLMEQAYSEADDHAHLRALAPALSDPRYLRVNGRPLLLVYRASLLPNPARTATIWRETARSLGLGELYLARIESFPEDRADPRPLGFEAAVEFQPDWTALPPPLRRTRMWRWLRRWRLASRGYGRHRVYDYAVLAEAMQRKPEPDFTRFPGVMPAWDNAARRQNDAVIFTNSSPARYEAWLASAVRRAQSLPDDEKLVFINAWNEWGEGCHLEPDQKYGRAYLEATARALGVAQPEAATAPPSGQR